MPPKENLMKKLILAVALVFMMAPLASALTYTGSLMSPSGVNAYGYWGEMGFKISWQIEDQADGSWLYKYWLTDAKDNPWTTAEVSHFTLEISPNAAESDFWFDNQDNLPGDLEFGSMDGLGSAMKMDWGATEYSFYSWKSPVWGDFYAKDGYAQSDVLNEAYNAGFSNPDPMDGPANGSIGNKILRPDTDSVIPEPGTMLLMGLGLAGAGIVRKIRK